MPNNHLENELPQGKYRAPRKKASAAHLRRARADLRGPDGPVAPMAVDDEPFAPPAEPWIGDVWVRKGGNGYNPYDVVDVVDVIELEGEVSRVHFETRGQGRTVRKLPVTEFRAAYGPLSLVPLRPVKS